MLFQTISMAAPKGPIYRFVWTANSADVIMIVFAGGSHTVDRLGRPMAKAAFKRLTNGGATARHGGVSYQDSDKMSLTAIMVHALALLTPVPSK